MADIRPTSGSPVPAMPTARGSDTARTAAQRAFFQAAVGRAQGSVEPAALQPAVRAAPQRIEPVQVKALPVDGEEPARFLRPGSLLDIKV